MSKVVITGSQGFIGSYVCLELLDKGYEVIGIDDYSKYGKVDRIHDTHPNFTFYEKDARDLSWLDCDPDYFIAGAAMIGGISYFNKYAYDLLATNERLTATAFDFCIDKFQKGSLKRIIVLSSSMVFESTNVFPTPESEVRICSSPQSTYGFQKLATEYFCQGAYEQYEMPYTIIRPFNCVGVGEGEAIGDKIKVGNIEMMMSHVLPDFVHKCLILKSSDKFPILGDGSQVRHYTNGKDIARGLVMAMESEKAVNDDFNISSPVATTVKELAEIVWSRIHGDAELVFEHHPSFPYDVQYRSPCTQKAKDVLGFESEVNLSDSVDEVIEWMKQQHDIP